MGGIRALGARLELVDGDNEMARARAAAILEDRERFSGRHVVTIVCGSNVDVDAYHHWVGAAAPTHKF
jgi:threonine dehydratase